MSKAKKERQEDSAVLRLQDIPGATWKDLSSGGKYQRDPDNPRRGWVMCPDCPDDAPNKVRRGYIPSEGSEAFRVFTGRCRACAALISMSSRRRGSVEHHPTGATLLRDVRSPTNVGRVAFLCPGCCPSYEHLSGWLAGQGIPVGRELSADDLKRGLKALDARCDKLHFVLLNPKDGWPGRCKTCRLPDSGGKFRRNPDRPGWGWVVCPDCPKDAPAQERKLPAGKAVQDFTGRCPTHAGLHRSPRGGVRAHKSGAVLLEDERDGRHWKASFICAAAAEWWKAAPEDARDRAAYLLAHPDSDCLVKDVGWFSQFDDDEWGGNCGNCARLFSNHPRTLKDDRPVFAWTETDGPDGLFVELLAWIRYSRGGEKDVPVWFSLCQHEEQWRRNTLRTRESQHRKRKEEFPQICTAGRREALAHLRAAIQAQFQNGNGLSEQPKKLRLDRGGFIKRLDKLILIAYENVKPKTPSRPQVASEFAIRGWRPATGPGIRDNMNRCGVSDEWEVYARVVIEKNRKPQQRKLAKLSQRKFR